MSQPQANPDAPLAGMASHVGRGELLAVVWTCFSIGTSFVALRLVVRVRQNGSLLPDDWCILFAWLCLLTMSILQTEQIGPLFYTTYLFAGRVQFPIIKLFWTTLWAVKASFMAVFFRLVSPFPIHRRLWYGVALFTFLAYVGCVISSALTCSPPSDYFVAGKCDSEREVWRQRFNVLFSTSVDIITDLMIMALPIAVLPSLQLDARKKIGLGVAFSLATLIICVAIVRMTQVIVADRVDLVGLAIWGAVETNTAVVVGCLPPLKALLSRGVRKYSTGIKSSQRYGRKIGSSRGNAGVDGYGGLGSSARSVMVSESIPLDHMHRSKQLEGGIYVQKMFETHIEYELSSREDDEASMIKAPGRTR
ncbi:quinoprotein amine dehydrogenase beta chain-like protein [Purpureocillium lavendulum]|uniref:Quinoprotein amine dehydrogenase beta chain-like protein n=1 Tax=Purpureocillium lavendulum TaxID=1247861 RepID=A0AB34G398_9HYPO|nr:quinoprotein amine dehydrogenase beta chain-like protein [Purpureocillium lavendulum]